MIKNGKPYTNENGYVDDELLSDFPEGIQDIVLLWIHDNIRTSKSVNKCHSSYGIKHILHNDTNIYLTNNQFKDAMMQCGHNPDDPDRLNWNFRISERSPAFTPLEKRKTPQSYLSLLTRVDEYYKQSKCDH